MWNLMNLKYSKLKVFTFTTRSEDIAYLNANRWEKLILKYLSQLEEFHFQYYEYIDDENESLVNLCQPNQFSSAF